MLGGFFGHFPHTRLTIFYRIKLIATHTPQFFSVILVALIKRIRIALNVSRIPSLIRQFALLANLSLYIIGSFA